MISVGTLEEGAFLGQTALTRQPVLAGAYALDEVTVLQMDRAHMEELVLRKPLLLQEIGRAIEDRRANVPAGIGYGPRLGGGRQLVVDPAPAPFPGRRPYRSGPVGARPR